MKILYIFLTVLISLQSYADITRVADEVGRPITGTAIGSKRALDTNDATKATLSTVNSSTTVLADAASFTGTAEDVSDYSTITVFVDTDLDGTLLMQFSSDGTNWDRQKNVVVDQDIGSGSVHTLEVVSQYFRVVYTNSTGNGEQGHFRLQTIYHVYKSGFLTSSPDEKISKINDAQIVRVSNDPVIDISRGLYSDKFAIAKFGHNDAVPNGSFADIWDYGATDASYNWMTSGAETFRVKAGGNANDTAAGSGCRSIQIIYLDSTGVQQQEQLALAGASASAETSSNATRLQRAWCDAVGTTLANNAGEVVIESSTTGMVVGSIGAGVGQTEMAIYTVPLKYTCYLIRVDLNIATGTNKDADIKLWQRRDALTFSAPFGAKRLVREWDAIQGGGNITEYQSLPSFPALTDIWLEAQGNGAVTEVDAHYDLVCVKNEAPTTPQ